jgi:cytosine deaminase
MEVSMDQFMQAAYEEAKKGRDEGGIPIGSVLVLDGKIIGRGHNQRVQKGSAILHAEMAALEDAGRLTPDEYQRSILYSTLSPCDMCSGAALLYKIPHVVVGENRTCVGAEDLLRSRGVVLDIIDDKRCVELLQDFIRENPALWSEDISVYEDELACCS